MGSCMLVVTRDEYGCVEYQSVAGLQDFRRLIWIVGYLRERIDTGRSFVLQSFLGRFSGMGLFLLLKIRVFRRLLRSPVFFLLHIFSDLLWN